MGAFSAIMGMSLRDAAYSTRSAPAGSASAARRPGTRQAASAGAAVLAGDICPAAAEAGRARTGIGCAERTRVTELVHLPPPGQPSLPGSQRRRVLGKD
jgi:hypothetical protein